MRRRAAIFLIAFAFAAASPAAPVDAPGPDLVRCAALDPDGRAPCIRAALAPLPPEVRAAALAALADSDPAGAVGVARSAPADAVPAEPAARAAWLDAEGEALARTGRAGEAVSRFAESLALDDGTVRLTWFAPSVAEPVWTAAVGPGVRRHRRAAAAASAAGDVARARAWTDVANRLAIDDSAADHEGAVLTAPPWRIRLPPIEYDVMQGGRGRVGGPDDRVWLIDFWASWCAPCVEELPHLVELRRTLADAGLDLVLVNVGESRTSALPFVRSLGVDAPVAAYNAEFAAALDADTLPTLVLVDRRGDIRGRWNGYRAGLIAEIEPIVRRVLEERESPGDPVARVLVGDGTFRVDWFRGVPARVEDLAAAPGANGTLDLVASLGRRVARYGPNGRTVTDIVDLPMTTAIVAAPSSGDGSTRVIGFRRGAGRLVVIDLETEVATSLDVETPLLDVESADPAAGRLILAGVDGVWERRGDSARRLASGLMSDVQPADGGYRVLEAGRRILRIDGDDAVPTPERDVPADAWRLLSTAGGVGTLSAEVADAEVGRFMSDRGPLLAVVTTDGTLTVVSPEDGRVVFRAVWPGLHRIAAVDLDGDGVHELAVAAGERLGVLREAGRDTLDAVGGAR